MTDAVVNNGAEQRYELTVDGETGFAAYRTIGDGVILFTHTIVPSALEGRGLASKIIGFALDDVRRRGLKLVPQCAFVAAYMQRHPETQDLLAEGASLG